MNKKSRELLFLWLVIAASAGCLAFIITEHLGAGTVVPIMGTNSTSTMQPDASVPMQNFSNDGYAFSVPASWAIERTGMDTVALHPDASSPDAACKIEVSAFPYAADMDAADWIAHRIGADPSLTIVERSSGEVALASGTAVQWTGTIDGATTTLIYAFNAAHAYEIAPSIVGADATDSVPGATQCDDMMQTFLSTLTI